MPEQHEQRGDTHTPAWRRSWSSPPFLCSCRSLSRLHLLLFVCTVQHSCHHSQRATCLCLLGHTTNSRSLALIELMFLFRGSCLVSLSLWFTLATLLSSHNLYSRLLRSDQLLVSSLSYIWYRDATTAGVHWAWNLQKARRTIVLQEALLNITAWHYLVVLDGASLLAVLDFSWHDWCWRTSPIRYHTPMLFISLCKEKEVTNRGCVTLSFLTGQGGDPSCKLETVSYCTKRRKTHKVWWLIKDTKRDFIYFQSKKAHPIQV